MPRVFDNLTNETRLLPAIRDTLKLSYRADFCIGYFNLRGWSSLDDLIEPWIGGDVSRARILIGMQTPPDNALRRTTFSRDRQGIDNGKVIELTHQAAIQFREQLTIGAPTAKDEAALRRLSRQLRDGKVVVKLHLRHPLHAKLYLLYRHDPNNPITGFLGSSNLTFAGLSGQGELNLDVLDHDATNKLTQWFDARWVDNWCVDVSLELADAIDNSWARERTLSPYHIYLKIAYHLSQEARSGLAEFQIPAVFSKRGKTKLFDFQAAAVQLAAHHLNRRGGVMIGDVVGLGKTLMATAVARIFEEDQNGNTLIICPKNLVEMWNGYIHDYNLRARTLPVSMAAKLLNREFPFYKLVIIDESHNLRNPDGKRYKAIRDYITATGAKCLLLTATPYNKQYTDLAAQLGLFVSRQDDLGIRPERQLATAEGLKLDCLISSLAAFEQSKFPEDWRELMRLYLVRRTRSFIQRNYASTGNDGRKYLPLPGGDRSYFPTRTPKKVEFRVNDGDPDDQYARLYSDYVVNRILGLHLPRYGLATYVARDAALIAKDDELKTLEDLSRARTRLLGFTITNLFKRLESGGAAFLQSVEHHVLRNFIVLHAIEHDLPLPIGQQDAALLNMDSDQDTPTLFDDPADAMVITTLRSEAEFKAKAARVYNRYANTKLHSKFKWLRPQLFSAKLKTQLQQDCKALLEVLARCGDWQPQRDTKLDALYNLLTKEYPNRKVLIFTQFADTANYLAANLRARGLTQFAAVTGQTQNPTAVAWRFSPRSNDKPIPSEQELRVLLATDVLSEGQNLQDAAIVVNFDLPWAIIRLIQRVGRVDRIGQSAEEIICRYFLPTSGVERIIHLHEKIRGRLRENAEVVGADERFFEDDTETSIVELYHEKAGILDGEDDEEVDLASYAYQIWQSAPKAERDYVESLPAVVYSARAYQRQMSGPSGVLVYSRTPEGNDTLAWTNQQGYIVKQSPLDILQAAACRPDEPAVARLANHHDLVRDTVEQIVAETNAITSEGRLGPRNSARRRTWQRLNEYAVNLQTTAPLFHLQLAPIVKQIYEFPLHPDAVNSLNRQLRAGINDRQLAELCISLYDENRLVITSESKEQAEAQIICSLGLVEQP